MDEVLGGGDGGGGGGGGGGGAKFSLFGIPIKLITGIRFGFDGEKQD